MLSADPPRLIKSTSVDFQLDVAKAHLMTDVKIWRMFFEKGPPSKTNLNTSYSQMQN